VNSDDFSAVVRVARESAIWRLGMTALDACAAAWQSSRLALPAKHLWSAIAAWPDEARLRFAASMVVWAAVGHAAGVLILPRYVTSGLPVAWAATLAVGALVVAAFPGAFVLAWRAKFRRTSTRA
jgi:hypothetical protein